MSNGWYVESLLRNREKIRSSIIEKSYIDSSTGDRLHSDPDTLFTDDGDFYAVDEVVIFDLYNEDYTNLLLVEKKLKELIRNKQLSTEEANVVTGILQHKSLKELGEELNIQSRVTLITIFRRVCSRLEFLLGDGFSDEGYLANLAEKYNLDEEQIQKGRDYMNSNKRLFTTKPMQKE